MANKKWAVREIETNNDNINNSDLETVYYSPKSYQNVLEYLPTVSNNGSAAAVNNAKKEYEIKSNYYKDLEKNYRNKANESNVSLPYQKSDFTTPSRMIPDNFTILRNDEKSKKDNISQIHSSEEQEKLKSGNIVKKELSNPTDLDITPKLREGLENKKRYEEFVKKADIKSMLEELPKARNEVALSKYNLDLEKVNKEDTSFYDKTLGRFIRGGASMLPSVNPTYIRDDGVEVNLPTYNDLKEQKTIQNYTTGIGKFAGDAAANLGRIAVSAAINNVIPYAGTAIYFGDMFVDQYNNNLLNGYDESASLLNASVGTATEAITEKLLGGVSKKLFGGNSSELSVEISKGISKLTKNKTIVNIFSNGASEAIEEFLQTYAEKLNEQLTLKKEFDAKELFSSDTLSEAIYSAGIGAVTGGVLSGFGKVDSEISNVVDNNIITSNMIENIENQQGRTLTKNEKRKIGKYIENTSNKDISPEKENLIKKVGTKIVDANGKTTYNTPSVGLDLVESYRAYNGNINKINDINNIQNFMNKRNLEARFDATKFDSEKQNAIWQTKDGKTSVIFNPNATQDQIIEEIATHEMTHDILNQKTDSGNNLFKDALNYAKTTKNYKEMREELENTYSKYYDRTSNKFSEKIDEEIVANTLGKQLGTQEYINRIVNNNPNIAQKIYRWVINKLQTSNTVKDNNEVAGFKNEKLYWEGVKNKFEKAYNEEKNTINEQETRYGLFTKNKTPIEQYLKDLENVQKLDGDKDFIYNKPGVMELYGEGHKGTDFFDERGNTKLEFKIPAEKLILDDIFSDNADVKVKLDNSKELDISSYLVNDEIGIDSLKEKQLEIIKNNNPVNDDYHTWIRNIKDIKTLEETINDSDWKDYDEYNPDLSRQDIETAIKNGKITIYSSYPIKPGIFISPSKMEAESYSSNGKVYSKEVNINDVAWIDPTQGQYVNIEVNTDSRNSLVNKNNDLIPLKGTKTKIGELFGKESHLENKQTNKNMILPIFKESKVDLTNSTNKSLPTYNDIKKLDKNKLPSFKDSVYQANDASKNINLNKNKLKIQNINKISDNKDTINKLVDSRNKTLKNIDDQIKLKRELYSKKQNKDTKVANIIQQQVITMEARKKSISEAYKQKIDRLEERNKKLSSKENITNLQRKNVSMKYMDLAESLIIDNIDSWKDKSTGIQYKSEKMERNIYDIIPDKKVASKIVDTYITPLKIAEVNQKNFINEYVERIKKLNLTNEESVAVQLLGESKFNISNMEADTERAKKILNKENAKDDVKSNAQFYLDALDYMKNNNLNIDKIQNAIKVFRTTYEELFVKINSVLKEQGFKEMEYRENYFPHFVEEKATSKIGKLMEKLGWKKINNNIPTDIAGITDTFKPGKTFFNHLLHRRGPLTEYNALKGFDNYIAGASNLIYLTEPIQKLRAFENEIRYLHSEKGIQEKYNEIIQSDVDTDTKESQITQLFANASNPLNNFVTELRSYTDGIANKKSELDRRLEQAFNRGIYSTMSNIQSRVSANMVGLNISSALTNFIPITQAYSQVSTKNMIKAIKSTISNSINSDNFVENSEFLSNRLIKSEKLYQTKLEKINEKTGILFDAVDSFTSNVVVRAKYLENIDKGMNPSLALKNADTFANNVMAGRDKASLPTIFNAKNPFIKLFSSFQLEVNNQYRYMLKDLPNDLKDEALSKLIGAFAKMFFGAWFYNIFSEKITGRKSAFSPADIVLDGINTMSNENNSTFTNGVEVVKDVAGELPFLGNILGGGRLPISSALPNLSNTIEAVGTISKKDVKEKTKKTAINNLIKELSKPVFYIVPPFGGGQAKKTIEGLSMYANDIPGSYTSSGRLRFVADKGFLPVAQAAVFGQYASKNARDYFDNNYTPLSEKQIEEFKSLNVGIEEYRTYLKKYAELNKITSDKDSNNNVIKGSAKAKKIYQIMNDKEKYNEKEINYILYKLSTETDKINLDDILLLDNNLDCYKYYFSLSNESREKYKALILNNNLNQSKYISSVKKINEIKEKYSNIDNPYSGSMKTKYKNYLSVQKRNELFKVINDSNISKVEKIILYENAGYSISNYKQYIFSYINSLNISKEEKEKLWNYLYDN